MEPSHLQALLGATKENIMNKVLDMLSLCLTIVGIVGYLLSLMAARGHFVTAACLLIPAVSYLGMRVLTRSDVETPND